MHNDMTPNCHLGEDYYWYSKETREKIFSDPIDAYIVDYAVKFKRYWIENTRNCIWKHDGTRRPVVIRSNKKQALIDHMELKRTGYMPLPGASEGWLTANPTWQNIRHFELIYKLIDADKRTYYLRETEFYHPKT